MLAIGIALISLFLSLLERDLIFLFPLIVALGIVINGTALAHSNRYRIYERRIDIERGIVNRSADSLWFFEVTDVTYEQPLLLLLAGTAEIA